MTLLQSKLIKHLKDKDVKFLSDAGRKAGYTRGARNIYRQNTKRHIQEALKVEPESIKAHYEALYALCLSDNDKATAKGILDSLCRVCGLFKDNTTVNVRSLAPEAITPEILSEARLALETTSL